MNSGRWLRDHPDLLLRVYQATRWLFLRMDGIIRRLGYKRADRLLRTPEKITKEILFECRMCGQCVLHSTGMTCPKNLRNGPCGGVRQNGHCEVIPEMPCIWVEAVRRSGQMRIHGDEIRLLQPPVNHQLEGTSAWINLLTGADQATPYPSLP